VRLSSAALCRTCHQDVTKAGEEASIVVIPHDIGVHPGAAVPRAEGSNGIIDPGLVLGVTVGCRLSLQDTQPTLQTGQNIQPCVTMA
jgi:hypothetical protein